MSITKRALLASGATLALATNVRAQGPTQGSNQEQDVLLDHLFDNQAIRRFRWALIRGLRRESCRGLLTAFERCLYREAQANPNGWPIEATFPKTRACSHSWLQA